MKLVFSAQGVFPERTVAVTGPGTQYAFNLPTGVYSNVDASIVGAVASDAFWLPGATALVREVPRLLPLLMPREFRAADIVFRRGPGWHCRSPTAPASAFVRRAAGAAGAARPASTSRLR